MKLTMLGVVLGVMSVTAVANAEDAGSMQLALDLDVVLPQDDPALDTGGGGMLRFGYGYDAVLVHFIPEVGVGYTAFDGLGDPTVFRGVVGARLRLGKVLEPGAFGHIGFGTLSIDPEGAEDIDTSRTALTYDVGLSLDFTLLPLIDIGAHASYNYLNDDDPRPGFDWFLAGLHAALVF